MNDKEKKENPEILGQKELNKASDKNQNSAKDNNEKKLSEAADPNQNRIDSTEGEIKEEKKENTENIKEDKKNEENIESVQKTIIKSKIFVVHGDDEEMKDTIVPFLRELNLDIILTQNSPNLSQLITQKLEKNPGVSFVIVILSPDNFVYPRNTRPDNPLIRTSPKVVFELGYWLSIFGRDRVIAIHYDQKSFRLPTEYFDVIYIPFDKNNAWKNEIKDRLIKSGLKIKT